MKLINWKHRVIVDDPDEGPSIRDLPSHNHILFCYSIGHW